MAHRASRKTSLSKAFTIVELLIVIVVIAILATITIVSYNGIQQSARAAQQAAVANGYIKALANYVAINGTYPPSSGTRVCLGLDQAECVTGTAWNRNTTLDNALLTVLSSLPKPSTSVPLSSSPRMAYIPINTGLNLDGTSSAFLLYTIDNGSTCGSTPLASGTWPNFLSTAPSQGYTYTADSTVRVCIVPLPRL